MSSKLPRNEEQASIAGSSTGQSLSHQKSQLHLPIRIASPSNCGAGCKGSALGTTVVSDLEFMSSTPFIRSPNDVDNTLRSIREGHTATLAPSYLDYTAMNRGECLLKSLNILMRIHKREQEKRRLAVGNDFGSRQKLAGNSNRRPDKPEPVAYEFTSDMFNTSNPAAFYHVTHFLFEILDPKETETVFKGCWPLFDKKQEHEYRRASFMWATKIVVMNPEFFPNGSIQFALFVNPFGEKFLRFIGHFVSFIKYKVVQRRRSDETSILKPNYTSNSEEKMERVQTLRAAKKELLQRSVKALESTMKYIEQHNKRKVARDKANEENNRILQQEGEKLRDTIESKPHLFPENALSLMDIRSKSIKAEAKSFDCDPSNYSVTEDNLATVLTKEWCDKLKQVNDMSRKVTEFCGNHAKLCKLVEAIESNGSFLLDGSKLRGLLKLKSKDLGEYFQNVCKTIEMIWQDTEQLGRPSDELVETIEMQLRRQKILQRQAESIGNSHCSGQFDQIPMTREEEEQFHQEVLFETKTLQIKLEGIKWDRLSKCASASSPEKIFSWTPLKHFDVNSANSFQGSTRSSHANGTLRIRAQQQNTVLGQNLNRKMKR